MNEELKQLLRQEFIKTIIEDEDSFEDTNAGFRKFLKRKGSPVFNYKEGGEVKESKKTDAEIEEEIRQNKKQFLNRNPILDFYKGNTLFGLDLGFADKNTGEEFGQYNKKDIRDPRIGLTIVPDVQDETSSKWGISIGPKGGGLTFVKPFSKTGLSGDWEEIPESWYEDNIPDVNVLIPELPKMKKGGKAEKEDEALDPLSKYKSYSELDILKNLSAKHPTGTILEENILETMPMIEPMDILPPSARPVMPSLEQLMNALYREPIGIKNGGHISKGEKVNTDLTTTVAPMSGPNPQGIRSLFKQRKRYADGGIDFSVFKDPGLAQYYYNQINNPNNAIGLFGPSSYTGEPITAKQYFERMLESLKSELPVGSTGSSTSTTTEIPTVDPFSGQQVSTQDQAAFTQPQPEIFPQQDVLANVQPDVVQPYEGQSTPSMQKILQDYLGSLYSGPEIANMQEQTFGTSGLPGETGVVSDLRHATAASQVRDKIANATSMGYLNPAGILPQALGLFGSQALGLGNEVQTLLKPNLQNLKDSWEDIQANWFGGTQVPYGQSANTTYNQLLNNPSLPSAANYQRTLNVGSSDPGAQALGSFVGNLDYSTMNALRNNSNALNTITGQTANMADGGLTRTIPPARGPNPQGVESLFKKRYN